MSSSPQQGIEGWLATLGLSSCSMTWNTEKGEWLIIMNRDGAVASATGKRGGLRAALLKASQSLPRGREPEPGA